MKATDNQLLLLALALLGGTYILRIVICAPKLGIGNVTSMVLLGQILAAILIDHFGLLMLRFIPLTGSGW